MLLLKIGGGESINLDGVARNLAALEDPVCIVHGANALRDELARRLGVEKQVLTSVSGYTSVYSDRELMDVMLMAYAGLRNKRLVELYGQCHTVICANRSAILGQSRKRGFCFGLLKTKMVMIDAIVRKLVKRK